MSEEKLKSLLYTIEDNIPVEEYRSEGTSDGLTHYELDKDSWQYNTLEYIKITLKEKEELIKYLERKIKIEKESKKFTDKVLQESSVYESGLINAYEDVLERLIRND